MTMYSKDQAYPVTRAKFPHQILVNGISYTGENAFNNRIDFGWIDVSDRPEYNSSTQRVSWKPNVRAQTFWEIINKTDEEKEEEESAVWAIHRITRDQLLTDSDWSQIKRSDTEFGVIGKIIDTHKRINWETYRQELRDLPTTQTLPDITWPTIPS